MKISFSVTGTSAEEIRGKAGRIAEDFFGHSQAALSVEVRVLVVEHGDEDPKLWEADVEATE